MGTQRQQDERERVELTARLWLEFARLNATHFGGRLALREIRVSTRKQYGGYYQKANDLIVLSWAAYKDHGWEETVNTFRHEVAHIVHQDHSHAFWAVAHQLGCTRRYALPPAERNVSARQYIYECPHCKGKFVRLRRVKLSSCGHCDRKYNPAFQLQLVSSPAIRAKTDVAVRQIR